MSNRTLIAALSIAVCTAAASAAPTSVNLADYVRVGRYPLPDPSTTAAPAGNVLAQEASGVTWNKDTDTLFVVGDGGRSITQVSKTGVLIDTMTLATGTSPQGTAFYDPEGITYVGNGKFVFTEERDRQINLITYAAGTTAGRAQAQTVKLGTFVGNVGLEGLTYDPATNGFILVKESGPSGIFQTTVNFPAGTASNGSASTVANTNLFNPALLGLADFSDVYAFSNIMGSTDADYQNLLIISQASGRIVETDRSGNILSSLTIVGDPSDTNSIADQTHEGITMDANGIIYTVNEEGGGNGNRPELWVYAPRVVPEPTSGLLLAGVAGAGLLARRR